MERQPEITLFNFETIDWLLESVVDRTSAATIRRKLLHAYQIVEQKDASAIETLRQAEALMSQADDRSRLLEDERNALLEEKEKLLRDAKQLTSLPETIDSLTSTLSSAAKETRDRMAQSLEEMTNATRSHQRSIDTSSGETSKAIRDIKAVGESLDTTLSGLNERFQHSLKPEHVAELTNGFTDSVKTLTESIKGIPANVRAGLRDEMTLESFLKPFELRDKLSLKEEELKKAYVENQRLIDQLQTLRGSKAEVDLLLQQEKDRVGRRNQYVSQLQSELEVAEKQAEDIPELHRQLQEARTEAGQIPEMQRQMQEIMAEAERARSLSTDLDELNCLYDVAQEKIRSLGERLDSQTNRILQLEERETKTQQRARDLEESRSNFEAQIEQLTENLADAQTLHQEAKESLQGRLEDKVELLNSKDWELDNLRRDLGDTRQLQERLREANAQVQDLANQARVSNSNAATYLQDFSSSLARENFLRDKLDEATGEVQTLEAELENALRLSSDAETERQDLGRQLTDAKTKLTELEGQLTRETQRSLRIPEGSLGELASMYAELAREVVDLPILSQALAPYDFRTLALAIAPLLFRLESKTELGVFLDSGSSEWHCLENVLDGMPRPEAISRRKCTDHETECVLVRVATSGQRAVLEFYLH
ncbi:uncharacterized protein FPRO_10342 [Fusarium proliferatum ET1]|uniref:Uncharacterized protein n=1 Tax=Fusarium proliferatum (strain ET1) TaxID=1227346 RepID=A0A1L7VJZ7_FUSPR|nr:uncharacterized protein FPRO_10342 [Fusarium proliferatum ET1]CZR40754.1 uncharacterized protein FPRO_10342 [Fusarium proliferatum ET1]